MDSQGLRVVVERGARAVPVQALLGLERPGANRWPCLGRCDQPARPSVFGRLLYHLAATG